MDPWEDGSVARELVPDKLWELVEPLLPPEPPRCRRGRPVVSNRAAFTGILFVLKTGIPWRYLPKEMNCGSGMTCWRRLAEWQEAGVWEMLHMVLLDKLAEADRLDMERAAIDSASVAAPGGGYETGADPTNRGKLGTKRHVVVDGHGTPLAVTISGANVHDSQRMLRTVDAIQPIRTGMPGRPRQRPAKLYADKAYDARSLREALRHRGITPRIARRGIESKERLGRVRWVVERTLSWLNRFRRLKIRYEQRADIHYAFLKLGCILICLKKLGF